MHEPVGVPDLDVRDAHARFAAGAAQLVDVREPAELAEARIEGATAIPLGELTERMGELERDRTVAFVCRSGTRSAYATAFALRAGYDAANVRGGVIAWAKAGLPLESDA